MEAIIPNFTFFDLLASGGWKKHDQQNLPDPKWWAEFHGDLHPMGSNP